MKSRTQKKVRAQGPLTGEGTSILRRMIEPMVARMLNAKQTLTGWVHELGLAALEEVFAADAERLAGPKGKHREDRDCHHWGSTRTPISSCGRRVSVSRPRARTKTNRELPLPTVVHLAGADPLSERVVERLLLGGLDAGLRGEPGATGGRGAESWRQQERGESAVHYRHA